MSNILFNNLDISDELKKAVKDMGIDETTPVQEKCILPIIDGKDIVAQAPTGTGKTFAFGIPLIECTDSDDECVSGLILSPTRELCLQIDEELLKLSKYKNGIRIVPVYGGQEFSRQLQALKRHPQIIVATPGRLMDHIRRHTIKLDNLKFMILDEADEMLNMGFREDIDTILKSVPDDRQTMLFSATISPEIMEITKKYQNDAVTIKVERKASDSMSIDQKYIQVKSGKKYETLTRLIDITGHKTCMIFCNTKRMVDQLTEQLILDGYRADCIHGDMKQPQRDKVMNKFKRHSIDILVATDVAARGIDVDGIEAIFNYDLPIEDEYYIHRIGRTGRANKSGTSYSFVQPNQMYHLKQIMKYASCTITQYKMPSESEFAKVKSDKLYNEIIETISNSDLKKYERIIADFIEKSNGTVSAVEIASAILKRSEGKAATEKDDVAPNIEELPKKRRQRDTVDADSVRMFINVGSLDKVNKRSMLDLFKIYTNIDVREISAIDIFDKYSFINIPAHETENVIASLCDTDFKGRTVSIEVAQQAKKKPIKRSFNSKFKKDSDSRNSFSDRKKKTSFKSRKKVI